MRFVIILALVVLLFVFLGPTLLAYGITMRDRIMSIWYARNEMDIDEVNDVNIKDEDKPA